MPGDLRSSEETSDTRVGAVLAAGGSGSRFSGQPGSVKKQFLELKGRPLYTWSLQALCVHPRIQSVVVVAPHEDFEAVQQQIASQPCETECRVFVTTGGDSRQASVFKGLQCLADLVPAPEIVLVHDGARPFLSQSLLTSIIDEVVLSGACSPGLPVTDTLKRTSGGKIVDTVERSDLFTVQTPQAGRLADLLKAHVRSVEENWVVTDDAAMLERDGHLVSIVPGSPFNIKVTRPFDLILCEALEPHFSKEDLG